MPNMCNHSSRVAAMEIAGQVFVNMLLAKEKHCIFYKWRLNGKEHFHPPKNVKLIGIEFGMRHCVPKNNFRAILQSPDFDEVKEGGVLPNIEITYHRFKEVK